MLQEHLDATAYKYMGSHISDLCLIYGNESQNGRSSSFGHENGGQQ